MALNPRRRRRRHSFPDGIQPPPNNQNRQQLKDLLLPEDDYSSSSSCSSSGFASLPRFNLSSSAVKSSSDCGGGGGSGSDSLPAPAASSSLPRSRSRSRVAAEATISIIQKLVTAVVKKYPSGRRKRNRTLMEPLPRREEKESKVAVVRVTVKDVLRWESFRDLAIEDDVLHSEEEEEEMDTEDEDEDESETKSLPFEVVRTEIDISSSELSSVVNRGGEDDYADACATAEEGSGLDVAGSGSRSGGGSWEARGKVWTEDGATSSSSTSTTKKGELTNPISEDQDDDHHHHSPVSILDSPFRDDINDDDDDGEDTITSVSTFEETMASVERTKQRLLDSIKWFESLAAGDDTIKYDPFSDNEEEEENGDQAFPLESADFRGGAAAEEEKGEEHVEKGGSSAEKPLAPWTNKESSSESLFSQSKPLDHLTLANLMMKDGFQRLQAQIERKGTRRPHATYKNDNSNLISCSRVSAAASDAALFWTSFGGSEGVRDLDSTYDDEELMKMELPLAVGCELEAGMLNDMLDHLVSDLLVGGTGLQVNISHGSS